MNVQLTFRITLFSDYHLGAGHGLGRVLDSALQHDVDGIPVLQGSTIAALLRNALDELATTTALQQSPTWRQFRDCPEFATPPASMRSWQQAEPLFAAPWLAKRWRISSARPLGIAIPQAADQERWHNGGLSAHPAHQLRVDPDTHRAKARKLFVREEGTQNLEFVFTIECWEGSPDIRAEAALLVAAARTVRYLDAGRQRDRSRCAIRLESVQNWPCSNREAIPNQETLLDQFESYWLKGERWVSKATKPILAETALTGQPVRLLLIARADEPLVITRQAEADNQCERLASIPGLALRSAFVSRIRATYNLGASSSHVYASFTRLFFRGGMSCTSLYPALVNKAASAVIPTIPVPQDLFVNELHPQQDQLQGSGWRVYLAQEAAELDFKEQHGEQHLKLEPIEGFVALDTAMTLVRPERSHELQVTISAETGRAQEAERFGSTVLEAGQYFIGELVFADETAWERFQQLAQLPTVPALSKRGTIGEPSDIFTLNIGQGGLPGYGKLSAALLRVGVDAPPLAVGVTLGERVTSVTDPLRLLLVSDVIVLDPWGRSYQHFASDWLSDVLGFQVRIATVQSPLGSTHRLQFASTKPIDGFNAYLGLPHQHDIALNAGSAVTLEIIEPIDLATLQQRLAQIEQNGIGMRRNEGFGRVCFNHPIYRASKPPQLPLPAALRPDKDSPHTRQDRAWWFLEQWCKQLDEANWYVFQRTDLADLFNGMVREIHSLASAGPNQLDQWLDGYGPTGQLLADGALQRQKINCFTEEEQPGMHVIRDLLNELATLCTNDHVSWATGCRMLANRLAQELPQYQGA